MKLFYTSRLETRTKEYNICASFFVDKTNERNESEGSEISRWQLQHSIISYWNSFSISDVTRKMVNFACAG